MAANPPSASPLGSVGQADIAALVTLVCGGGDYRGYDDADSVMFPDHQSFQGMTRIGRNLLAAIMRASRSTGSEPAPSGRIQSKRYDEDFREVAPNVHVGHGEIVVTGTPPSDEDPDGESSHNCDAMRCGWSHVLYRAKLAAPTIAVSAGLTVYPGGTDIVADPSTTNSVLANSSLGVPAQASEPEPATPLGAPSIDVEETLAAIQSASRVFGAGGASETAKVLDTLAGALPSLVAAQADLEWIEENGFPDPEEYDGDSLRDAIRHARQEVADARSSSPDGVA